MDSFRYLCNIISISEQQAHVLIRCNKSSDDISVIAYSVAVLNGFFKNVHKIIKRFQFFFLVVSVNF